MSVHSGTFDRVQALAAQRNIIVSQHGYARLAKRGIAIAEIIAGVASGEPIEDYPNYHAGPAVLVLQADATGRPLHVVWGLEAGTSEPAVVVTAYRPDPQQWTVDFKRRLP